MARSIRYIEPLLPAASGSSVTGTAAGAADNCTGVAAGIRTVYGTAAGTDDCVGTAIGSGGTGGGDSSPSGGGSTKPKNAQPGRWTPPRRIHRTLDVRVRFHLSASRQIVYPARQAERSFRVAGTHARTCRAARRTDLTVRVSKASRGVKHLTPEARQWISARNDHVEQVLVRTAIHNLFDR